ncbi:unnamed protein product [Arabis nemorensis]|uniref:Uncharacterized protein n=1 Tax=Arabis nemorensis TaxID=586526 RepID=A0A565B6E9_9BRAS|nr:unnamed protein product [Arabis nemorensis]
MDLQIVQIKKFREVIPWLLSRAFEAGEDVLIYAASGVEEKATHYNSDTASQGFSRLLTGLLGGTVVLGSKWLTYQLIEDHKKKKVDVMIREKLERVQIEIMETVGSELIEYVEGIREEFQRDIIEAKEKIEKKLEEEMSVMEDKIEKKLEEEMSVMKAKMEKKLKEEMSEM